MPRLAALLAAISALALSMFTIAGTALATHVDPILIQGNAPCGELGDYDHEFKIEPVQSGDYADPNSDFEVTITVSSSSDGQLVAFESNLGVDALFVKGGPGGNLYVYDPAATSDDGLHAPGNDQGTAVQTPPWSGLSHLSFCFNETPTPSVSASASASTSASASASTSASASASASASVEASVSASASASVEASSSPEGSVLGGTGTPAPSTPDTALPSSGGPSPVPTVAFGLILLASLATLAYANVKATRQRS